MNLKALVLLIAGHFITDINTGALPAFLPFLKESLSLSYTMTASIILIFNVTSSVIQPIFGYFSDRWSARWLLPAGCFIASLGMALLGFAASYVWIFFFAALSGLGQGSYHPEGFKTVHFLGGEKKASVISFFLVGGSLGLSFGPLMVTLFFKHFGLKGSLLFLPPGVAMTIIFLITPYWKVKTDSLIRKTKSSKTSGFSWQEFSPIALLLLAVVLRSTTQLGIQTFVPFYLIDTLKQDPLIVGKYLSTFLLMGTIGSVAGGPLADRYSYKKTVLFSLGLASLFLHLFFYMNRTESLISFAIAGFFLNISNPITMAMGQSYMPQNLGMVSGLILGLAMGVGGIGTTILGWVADQQSLSLALQIIFILPISGLLIFLFVPYSAQHKKLLS
jgi:FSR family fosmidomycin resistance protein-like MFS transporter